MQSSLYNNCVLTVIAISLVYLCIAHVVQPPTVQAAQYSVPVIQSADGSFVAVPVAVFAAERDGGSHWLFTTKP